MAVFVRHTGRSGMVDVVDYEVFLKIPAVSPAALNASRRS
jgi:hypothetical protein